MIKKLALMSVFSFNMCFANSEIYPERYEGQESYYQYNGRRLDLVARFLPHDPVVFEAGGHYGEDTVRLAQMWPKGTIISFEPNPHAFVKMQKETRDYHNILIYPYAISDYNGFATLNVCHGANGDNPEAFEGASSLLEPSDWMKHNYKGPKVNVPCLKLDDFLEMYNYPQIDFMWLDLEGFEMYALKGSPKSLKNVKVIYVETNFMEFRKGMPLYSDLKKFLEDNQFELIAHWYAQGFQGNAIFVNKRLCATE